MLSNLDSTKDQQRHGVVLIGLRQIDRVCEILAKYPTHADGYCCPIFLVDKSLEDARNAALTLRFGDDTRFQGCFGPNANEELVDLLRSRMNEHDLPHVIEITSRELADDAQVIGDRLSKLHEEQRLLTRQLHAGVKQANLLKRDRIEYQFAETKETTNARVLLVTTRYSTYIQHSIHDFGQTLRENGHAVRVVSEPDPHTQLNAPLLLNAQLKFDPDIIVVANVPRTLHESYFPKGTVHLCWIQDAMSHLFEPFDGEIDELDFVAGHVYSNSPVTNSYPSSRRIAFPVPVSETKFHPAPVHSELRDKFTCDIAYISHQSKAPELYFEESLARWPNENHALLEGVWEQMNQVCNRWGSSHSPMSKSKFLHEIEPKLPEHAAQSAGAMLWHQFAHPLLERLLRHKMVAWASEIAEKHGLDFRLYGRGWEDHPVFSKHAYGELEHGETLRASYQCAKIQLHASFLGTKHQRQHECPMSGGLMLSLRSWAETTQEIFSQSVDYIRATPPDTPIGIGEELGYSLSKHPQLLSILEEFFRVPDAPKDWIRYTKNDVYPVPEDVKTFPKHKLAIAHRPLQLLGDSQAQRFSTKDELEERVVRMSHDKSWRAQIIHATRQKSLDEVSMRTFAQTVFERISMHFQQAANRPTHIEPIA
jgi:hypothetical protein